MAVLGGGTLLAIRANTVLGYRWDWSVIGTFLVRTDPITVSQMWHPRLDADPALRWLRGLILAICRGEAGQVADLRGGGSAPAQGRL